MVISMKRIQSRIGKAYYKDGITDSKRKTALRMVQQYGFSVTDAAAINEMDEKELRAWLKRKLRNNATSQDHERIRSTNDH